MATEEEKQEYRVVMFPNFLLIMWDHSKLFLLLSIILYSFIFLLQVVDRCTKIPTFNSLKEAIDEIFERGDISIEKCEN